MLSTFHESANRHKKGKAGKDSKLGSDDDIIITSDSVNSSGALLIITGGLMARNKENKELTYSQALAELEKIISRIESEEVDVDALAEQVKRASVLIRFCREKLQSTEEDVKKVLSEMESKPVQGNSFERDLGLL